MVIRRPQLSYANVTATLALVVALSGTSYAAVNLPRNSVGTPQLQAEAVTMGKLKDSAVTSTKVKDGSVAPTDLDEDVLALAAEGPASPTFLTGAIRDLPSIQAGGTLWERAAVSGVTPFNDRNSSGTVSSLSPSYPVVVRDLTMQVLHDVPAGGAVTLELVAQEAEGFDDYAVVLECEVLGSSGPGDKSCTSSEEVALPARQRIFVRITISASMQSTTDNDPVLASFSMAMTPTD